MFEVLLSPEGLVSLATLIALEIVLGIDNLVFIAIVTSRLPPEKAHSARRLGLGLAVGMRLALLAGASWLLALTTPVFEVAGVALSWKDMILIAGGLFLIGKATIEIHHRVAPDDAEHEAGGPAPAASGRSAILQIVALDIVFSLDSIIVGLGLTPHLVIIAIAVVVAVAVMILVVDVLSDFVNANPSVVMLALSFLVMIGMVLVADGFHVHVPKGFVYFAMAFSAGVEALNLFARRAARRRRDAGRAAPATPPH